MWTFKWKLENLHRVKKIIIIISTGSEYLLAASQPFYLLDVRMITLCALGCGVPTTQTKLQPFMGFAQVGPLSEGRPLWYPLISPVGTFRIVQLHLLENLPVRGTFFILSQKQHHAPTKGERGVPLLIVSVNKAISTIFSSSIVSVLHSFLFVK